jgi:putative transposase
MKESHFTETQILAAIQKHEKGIAIKDIVREMGVSEQTFYNWKAKYGGMQGSDIKKLRIPTVNYIFLK